MLSGSMRRPQYRSKCCRRLRHYDTVRKKEGPEVPLWRAAMQIGKPFFCDRATRFCAISLSVAVGCLLMVETAVTMKYAAIQKNYMTALQKQDVEGFYMGLRNVGCLIAFIIPVLAVHSFCTMFLKLKWRTALTRQLAGAYLAGHGQSHSMFYKVHLAGEIDNPDQRICQDACDFIETTLVLVQETVGTVSRVSGFAVMLYQISPTVCMGVIAYAMLGTLISTLGFGPWVMQYQQEARKKEATLRYCLIRTRENAESIAFFRGGDSELQCFGSFFDDLLSTLYRQIVVMTGFNSFKTTFHWATFAVGPLTVGPSYLRGETEFGSIAQAQMAFGVILGGLTLLMNKLESFSAFSVQVRRLHSFSKALEQVQMEATLANLEVPGTASIAVLDNALEVTKAIQIKDLTLRTPLRRGAQQQTLLQDVSLQLGSKDSLLIMGESGIGKSSLLRALAGLWTDGLGTIAYCQNSAPFFMPQHPYMVLGTLRHQLLYPNVERSDVTDDRLQQVLTMVKLSYLLKRHALDEVKEWANLLSIGEQQRINFARLLLRPGIKLAFIDEGTSGVDALNEQHLYGLLKDRLDSYVSVGHRPALRQHHTHALLLDRPVLKDNDLQADGVGPARSRLMPMVEMEKLASWGSQ